MMPHAHMLTTAHVLSPPSACLGAQLAQSILFIFASTVLSVFDIKKVVINGIVQEQIQQQCPCVHPLFSLFVDPSPLNSNIFMTYRHPKPFQSWLEPHSSKAESLVRLLDLP